MQVLMPRIDVTEVLEARELEARLTIEMRTDELADAIETSQFSVSRADGSLLEIRSYRPRAHGNEPLPALLFIHGGSFITGGLRTEDTRCEFYAAAVGCCVVAVDYRLAPEHPFPEGLDDCQTALTFLRDHATQLCIDVERIAVGGLSAGGALASGVATRCAHDGHPELVLQLLLFPVLDAALRTASAQHSHDTAVLTTKSLRDMWRLYLGPEWSPLQPIYPAHSSPAHEADFELTPPTFLCSAGLDPLRDEIIEHAQRLMRAGVPVDLRLYARGFHSFDSYHFTRLGRSALNEQVEALRAAFS